jgi:hypothetical protein
MSHMSLTRRELAASLLTAAAAAAQTQDAPEALVRSASDDLRKELAAIHQVTLDYTVEPAFSFRPQ